MFSARVEFSRCQDSAQGQMIVTTAVQLMEARCWQVAELAGNRTSGSKTFSMRQDEEK